ncbi:hypothetical protein V6N13_060168 [Hibiscus sabdariffa]|uniref:Uncharacterized protein n=1 Tax=Hibiscus sabdariffa TaxID=183260 RepID=A0ABR2GCJ5_9ROSI
MLLRSVTSFYVQSKDGDKLICSLRAFPSSSTLSFPSRKHGRNSGVYASIDASNYAFTGVTNEKLLSLHNVILLVLKLIDKVFESTTNLMVLLLVRHDGLYFIDEKQVAEQNNDPQMADFIENEVLSSIFNS